MGTEVLPLCTSPGEVVCWPAGCDPALNLSKMLDDGVLPEKYPRVSDVSMKTTAIPVVSRVRKFPAPLLPKMVELDPPNTAPISAPLPVCKSTTRISPKLTMIWINVIKVSIPMNS